MVDLKHAADYCVRITERMYQQSDKEVDHKGEHIGIFTEKAKRLLLHD
jgi:hypothetical protein